MSLALARKYRPRSFAEVAVQTHVANTLKGAIARQRLAHGYLLCGPRGTGKTTLARVLAMALNCENKQPEGEPCGVCSSCARIWSGGASLDVVEIDAASNRGVDDARELRERAMYAPSGDDRYKVYIVDEAHMLTREAWNALLKVLEEPPPRVVFVFATTDPQKIAQAAAPVLSRLQRFDLRRIGPAEIRERLRHVLGQEAIAFEEDALGMIARAADGGLRDALSLTDQVLALGDAEAITVARVREALGLVAEEEYLALLDLMLDHRAGDAFTTVQRLADAGVDLGALLAGLADLLRAQLAVVLGAAPTDVSETLRAALIERQTRVDASDLLRMLAQLLELEPLFRKSTQQQLLLETLLVRLSLLDRTVALEEVVRAIGGGEGLSAPRAATARLARPTDAVPPVGAGLLREAAVRPPLSAPAPRAAAIAPSTAGPSAAGPSTAGPSTASRTRAEPSPAAAPSAASAPSTPGAAPQPASLETIGAAWGAVLDDLRAAGRRVLATSLERTRPAELRDGTLFVASDPPDGGVDHAIDAGADGLLAVVRARWSTIRRVSSAVGLAASPAGVPVAKPERLTTQGVREQRIRALTAGDPLLAAAVETLDLELLD
jgi:DNA polymerase III subunit gamma/tau